MNKVNQNFLYEAESYQLNGILFDAQNELGRYAKEKQYGNAIEKKLTEKGIPFVREQQIGDTVDIPDFIVWDLIVIELKAKPYLQKDDFEQVKRYLHQTGLKLGIIVNFRNKFVKPQRVLKPNHQ